MNTGVSANEDSGAAAADVKSGRSHFHGCFAEILFDGDGRGGREGVFLPNVYAPFSTNSYLSIHLYD